MTNKEYWSLSPQEQNNFTGIIKWKNGDIEYRKNRKFHRKDGPAVICCDGSEFWYLEGKRHRIGGPAFINKNNKKIIELYWIYGQQCTKEAHDLWVDLMNLKELNSKL